MKSKIKEITIAFKKGLPNFSSAFASITYTIADSDDIKEVWDKARQEAWNNCDVDDEWIREGALKKEVKK